MAGQSGISQHGVQFPTAISQSGELWPEAGEAIPYPLGAQAAEGVDWPPPGFQVASEVLVVADTTLSSIKPLPYDLEWPQGDTPQFEWLFTDVVWLPENPVLEDENAPAWVETLWYAQMRNPYLAAMHSNGRWVPNYSPGGWSMYQWWVHNSFIADFDVTATAVESDEGTTGWATKVVVAMNSVSSGYILPGSHYRWALKTRFPAGTDALIDDGVRTRLSGKVRVFDRWALP